MSALDLDALQKLADEATPGPWEATYSEFCCNEVEVLASGEGDEYVEAVFIATAWAPPNLPDGDYRHEESNAAFIAAARTAIPALIARVRELEALADTQRTDTKQETP